MTEIGPRFARAVVWSSTLHRGQRRKGTRIPYAAHPLAVAGLVLADGGSETEAVAALLHDVIEDCGVRPRRIRRRFGRKVARIVKGCTDDLPGQGRARRKATSGGKAGRKPKARAARGPETWRARKERLIAHLADPGTSESVLRVKAADSLDNARSIVADLRRVGPEVWQRFNAGAVDQLWYYRSLANLLGARHPGVLTDELRAAVRDMETLAGWWFDVGDPQEPKRAR